MWNSDGQLARSLHTVAILWTVGVACPVAAGCGGKSSPSVVPTPTTSVIRGTEEAADSVSDADQTLVYRVLLRRFYRPTDRQARWIDPQPLGEKRGAPDTTIRAMSDDEMPPDATWAESVVQAGGMQRVCVLGGAEDACGGRQGGILRFSPPYSAGPGRVHVFARYTPHGGAVGPVSEMRFTLERRNEEWRIVAQSAVSNP